MWIHLVPLGLIDGASAVSGPVPTSAGRSGVSRLWLVEYYTREFAKKPLEKATTAQATPAEKRKATIVAKVVRKQRIAALVDKAEADLADLTSGIKDAEKAQQFTKRLLAHAQSTTIPETKIDFLAIAQDYRERIRRDDEELMMLAMVI